MPGTDSITIYGTEYPVHTEDKDGKTYVDVGHYIIQVDTEEESIFDVDSGYWVKANSEDADELIARFEQRDRLDNWKDRGTFYAAIRAVNALPDESDRYHLRQEFRAAIDA